MAVSVTEPLNEAFEQTKRVLFAPFRIGKWFIIGFAAWVTLLTGGNVGGNIPTGIPGGGGGGPTGPPTEIIEWVGDNLALVIAIIAGISILGFVLIGVLTWLRSRFIFILIDCLVRNRAHIIEPWSQFAVIGNSLFLLRMLIVATGYFLSIGLLLIGLLIAWPDLSNNQFETAAITSLIVVGGVFLVGGLAFGLIGFFIDNVVTPIMYARSIPSGQAWSTGSRLLSESFGTFVLFFLMKVLLAIAVGTIAMLATFLSCCITAIPYIGTVLLLPLFVFPLLYTLKFIARFGPEFDMFDRVKHLCEKCRYNLVGLEDAVLCPECGAPLQHEPETPPTTPPTAPSYRACEHCGFDLTGLEHLANCPECSAPVPPPAPPEGPPEPPPAQPPES